MVNDIIWLLISFAYVFIVLLIAFLMGRKGIASIYIRKTVHILVSLWIFIMAYGMESFAARMTGPVIFTIINFLFFIHNGRKGAGIIFYPFSIALMIILMQTEVLSPSAVVAGTLAMGLGDGAAAIAGTLMGKKRKSIEGSGAMYVVVFNIVMAVTGIGVLQSAVAALAAAISERISPSALDNLTVPLITAGAVEVLCAL